MPLTQFLFQLSSLVPKRKIRMMSQAQREAQDFSNVKRKLADKAKTYISQPLGPKDLMQRVRQTEMGAILTTPIEALVQAIADLSKKKQRKKMAVERRSKQSAARLNKNSIQKKPAHSLDIDK